MHDNGAFVKSLVRAVMDEANVDEITAMQAVAAQEPDTRFEKKAFEFHDNPAIVSRKTGRVIYYVGDYINV